VELRPPDGSIVRPTYNEANLLERIEANLRGAASTTVFVADIVYNAKGQRVLIDYGNGAVTSYTYEPLTFRLTRLRTTRSRGSEVLQDLRYTYDPAGNITHIRDDAQQTIYFDNAVVEPHAEYTYDALYRLIEATGREHIGQNSGPGPSSWDDALRVRLVHPHDGQAMRRYSERYEYDAVGNFLKLIHQALNGSWTREYAYAEPSLIEPAKTSNRLSRTTVGATVESYTHDAHGNMTRMPHLPLMRWDFKDQLQATAQQMVSNGGTPETTYYVYDSAGQRVRKVTEREAAEDAAPTRMKERIYLGGFELYREYAGDGQTLTLERETLHITDDKQRIALVETRTQGNEPGVPQQLIRYQLGNHLGSASLELDDQAQILSYEEYTPYGSTSYQAVRSQTETPKRYRYAGKERDEESGLYYHGARYYSPWLGRWTSTDPVGIVDSTSLFPYARNNPVDRVDATGKQSKPKQEEQTKRATPPRGQEKVGAPAKDKAKGTSTVEPRAEAKRDEAPHPTIRIHIIDASELGFKGFDATARAALRQAVIDELSFLKGGGFEVAVDFTKPTKDARKPEDFNVYLVEPKISPEKLKSILSEYGIEVDASRLKEITDGLASQKGKRVGGLGPGAILVPVGSIYRDIGEMANIGDTDREISAAHETMGIGLSKIVLHELGHDLGLEHTKNKKGEEVISNPQHIMDFRQNLTTSITKEKLSAIHFTKPEKTQLIKALKTRFQNTGK
jgi:RHS repeat-associated protein